MQNKNYSSHIFKYVNLRLDSNLLLVSLLSWQVEAVPGIVVILQLLTHMPYKLIPLHICTTTVC